MAIALATTASALAVIGGPLPTPLPLFPRSSWWNLDISNTPIDPNSANYIAFIGAARRLHPDFGGDVSPGSVETYGMPYVVVDNAVSRQTVQFRYHQESDGVNHATGQSYPFYPIPEEAKTQPHWIEGGQPDNVDLRNQADRHLIIVNRDDRTLYELFNVHFDGITWQAGSGAFFDLTRSDRRPEGWTSADAAGLAILPGLVRYDEANGSGEHRARVPRNGPSNQRVRLPRVASGGQHLLGAALGCAAASQGQQRPLVILSRRPADISGDAAVRTHRR
ncbi:MAG: hypothetical protein FJW27_14435 [Acidimicrobiia bacterium]|nr:hypothetical protein [Acidimicrobiia bacterium]